MNNDNPFKKLDTEYEAPPRLKERVMTSVELSKLLIEITDLFTGKMGKTALDLLQATPKKPGNDAPASP